MASARERNLIITGFMATGKTTIGELTAKVLSRPFIDTDRAIERDCGLSVAAIFATRGEAVFRRLESALCRALAAKSGLVIATGGGTLVDKLNFQLLTASGLVICLTASNLALQKRLSNSQHRPLAGDWQRLLKIRQRAYARFPHRVDTTDKAPSQVVAEVIEIWNSESR